MARTRLVIGILVLMLVGLGCDFLIPPQGEVTVPGPPPTVTGQAARPAPTVAPTTASIPPTDRTGAGGGTIALGQTATGELNSEDDSEDWILTSTGTEYVTVDVIAPGWDATLRVIPPVGEQLAYNDDGGEGSNPRIAGLYLFAPGEYIFRVAAYSGSGDYEITLTDAGSVGGGTLTYGQTVEDSLEEGERHYWTFVGAAGDEITISMEGVDGLDTYLELRGADGDFLVYDDDSGDAFSALIEDYTLPSSGTFWIVAGTYQGYPGDYRLTVEKSP